MKKTLNVQSTIIVGDLVTSTKFEGIGKVIEKPTGSDMMTVGFFESPLHPESNKLQINAKSLNKASLYEEKVIYCRDPQTDIWCRVRYMGEGPDGCKQLVTFRKGENALIPIEEIYCLNLVGGNPLNPAEFLATQANDSPFFFPLREDFVNSYIEQRAACRSISSFPSSSVELEQHQLAVVRRVLQDPVPKYLLADEVGLGKTVETGLIIREHVLERKQASRVVVAVPKNLIGQWRQELATRFFLEELFCDNGNDGQIKICAHEDLLAAVHDTWPPTLLAVDEAHQLARMAWSKKDEQKELYSAYAQYAERAEIVLLLSGTPLHGNEKNFLAMLHCLNPEAYPLDDAGVTSFMQRVEERERLGGLYSALIPGSDNASIDSIVDDLVAMFPDDNQFMILLDRLRPLVDIFSPQEGDERREAIQSCRRYLGEHYRLHQRLLRNRREHNDLELLFPGLAGLIKQYWQVDPHDITLDELLEEYRSQALADPDYFKAMSRELCLHWIDDLLTSPLAVGSRAAQVLIDRREELSGHEQVILQQLVEIASKEQEDKDRALLSGLQLWFQNHPDGKAVVFCTRQDIAAHIYDKLKTEFRGGVELNKDEDVDPLSNHGNNVRVLLCDRRGEDGLNLHGGSRLAVHYSLPRDFSRIEQRLGRFNRYSANLIRVRPVQSLIVLPDRLGITGHWVELLDSSMKTFNQTLASLQYMLEEQIESTWQIFCQEGCSVFSKTGEKLTGDNGLIALESRQVRVQEELLSMEEEVQEAFEFAEQLEEADEAAEEQVKRMTGWIKEALQFRQIGKRGEGFRFQFILNPTSGGRTLVDVHSFLSTCLLGIDPQGGYPPITMAMSASRTEVSNGRGLYPFRYGQPFVDTIWDLLESDGRGTTMAILRKVEEKDLEAPELYFRFSWLVVAHEYGANRVGQRIADENFPPLVETFWLRQDGRPMEGDTAFLDKPYEKHRTDLNLRSSVWDQLKDWLPKDQWQRTVLSVTEQAHRFCLEKYETIDVDIHSRLLSCKAVILCSPGMFTQKEA
jgi:ATP-dependent helicase HepA